MVAEFFVERAFTEVTENHDKYMDYLKDLINRVRYGAKEVFIFGTFGTGKTTLSDLLEGTVEIGKVTGEYIPSPTEELSVLAERRFSKVLTMPGQENRRSKSWGKAINQIKNAQNALIIDVVCFGYQSTAATSLESIPTLANGVTPESLSKYLGERRQEEIASVKYLVDSLGYIDNEVDFVTLVTKQDLWWNDRDQVKKHYSKTSEQKPSRETPAKETTYADQIKLLRDEVGNTKFSHTLLSSSLANVNMQTSDNKLVVPTTGGYDAKLMYGNFANMLGALRQLYR